MSDGIEIIVLADDFESGKAEEGRIEMDPPTPAPVPPIVKTIMERYDLDFGETEEFRFNPSQPRAKDGKWMSGGGQGASSDDPKIQATDRSRALAAGIYAKAVEVEPEITSRIAAVIGDSDPGNYHEGSTGGELYGYSHRLKTEEGIATKIERIRDEKGYNYDEAAADVKDAVRYTVHYPDDSFGPQAQTLVDTLRAENAKVTVKNTWPPDLGSAYKGINIQVVRKDGVKFEVQIHTPTSQRIKDQMHKLYEEQRVLPRSSPRWQAIEREMLDIGNSTSVPTGAIEVFELMNTEPTQYFVARNSEGKVSAVARWYLPNSIATEVNTGTGWREADLLMDLNDDTGWEPVDEEVEIGS